MRDHVARIVKAVQLRVQHSGSDSAYQLVRGFYGLRELADANRPQRKKTVKAAKAGGASSSVVADPPATSPAPPTAPQPAPTEVGSLPVTRGAGKRLWPQETPEAVSKRAKVRASPSRVEDRRGKGAKRVEKPCLVDVPPLAATDTEAAELAFHTISEQLVMPNEYTAMAQESNRRLAGTASQFFFGAQIGFSQIILLNDRLSKTVDDNVVEIASLKKSLAEGRSALVEELRPQLEKGFAEQMARKDQDLKDEKEASKAVREERDRLRDSLQKSEEIERTLLEE
ncbi:unnamed protein product [Linum trigynum]